MAVFNMVKLTNYKDGGVEMQPDLMDVVYGACGRGRSAVISQESDSPTMVA